MKKYLTGLLVAAALFLVACGNGGSSEETTSAEDGSTQVTVAVENASNPLSYTDENGDLTGYEVELIQMLDEQIEEYSFNIESVDAEAAQVGLDTGKYAFIGGGLFRTNEREEMYLFPEENTGKSIIRIYRRADDDSIQSLNDLSGKTVAPVTPNGGIFNLFTEFNEANPDNQIDIVPGESGTTAESLQGVDNGSYDALVLPSNLGNQEVIDQLGLDIEEVAEPVQVNNTHLMLAQGQEDLVAALDEATIALKEDGSLAELSNKWYGENIFDYETTEQE